jgi:hypothetical protein
LDIQDVQFVDIMHLMVTNALIVDTQKECVKLQEDQKLRVKDIAKKMEDDD